MNRTHSNFPLFTSLFIKQVLRFDNFIWLLWISGISPVFYIELRLFIWMWILCRYTWFGFCQYLGFSLFLYINLFRVTLRLSNHRFYDFRKSLLYLLWDKILWLFIFLAILMINLNYFSVSLFLKIKLPQIGAVEIKTFQCP